MEIEIKKMLDEYNISISEFARKLNVSRPTIYKVIRQYEENSKLDNEKFNIIFDGLFKIKLNEEEFKKLLEKFSKLIERDKQYQIFDLDPERTDIYTNLSEKIKLHLSQEYYEKSVFDTIRMLLNNYDTEENNIFKLICRYFYLLNNSNEDFDNNVEKVFISNLYEVLSNQRYGKLELKQNMLEEFNKRRYEIKNEENIKIKMKELINTAIQEEINKGKDKSVRDIKDVILKMIDNLES